MNVVHPARIQGVTVVNALVRTIASTSTDPLPDEWRIATSRAAHPSAREHDEPLVAAIAEGLAAVAVPWELATGRAPDQREYELILSTDVYDAWLIHWPVGIGLDAHDHGGSIGAFAVVSGVLDEDTIDGDLTVTRRVVAGSAVHFDGDHVHAVVNRGAVGATSVHVYSPPLRTMGFYRATDRGALVIERVDGIGEYAS
jgi:hypothetical protein